MIKPTTCMAALVVGLSALSLGMAAQDDDRPAASPGVRLGTFDSRVVAIAYYRSDRFEEVLAGIRKQHEEAKAAGDEETASELENAMAEKQKRAHRQGFGNAPIADVLELIQDRLPDIAEGAGVDVIVSKWDLVYSRPSSTFIDVSFLLAEEFDPDEETLEILRQAVAVDPVPLEELDHHDG